MKFGVQLYGLMEKIGNQTREFFSLASKSGLNYLEPCIRLSEDIHPHLVGHSWNLSQLETMLQEMNAFELQVNSVHLFANPAQSAEGILQMREKFGISQFIFPANGGKTADEVEQYASVLSELADRVSESGALILVHNSKDEGLCRIGELSSLEYLLKCCKGKVGIQPDLGWLMAAGLDPETFLWKYQDLIWNIHYKDGTVEAGIYTEKEIGEGSLDIMACFQFARAREIPHMIDQDHWADPMEESVPRVTKKLRRFSHERANTNSILSILDTETGELTPVARYEDRVIEAPNWSPDGKNLYFNSEGLIYSYDLASHQEKKIDTGDCRSCNNDHVLSASGKRIAVSCQREAGSQIFIVDLEGKEEVKQITSLAPSYLHGWSPDEKELAYCAFRWDEDGLNVDIYAISDQGGQEWALTHKAGFNDGPEYSPDGKEIWFISTRSGLMQAWKMNRDGSDQKQMTFSRRNNWFPHISPDNRKVVFLSYSEKGLDPNEHLANMHVELYQMDPDGSNVKRLLKFFGGQGSINVNSWAPDSRRIALVTYELNHK